MKKLIWIGVIGVLVSACASSRVEVERLGDTNRVTVSLQSGLGEFIPRIEFLTTQPAEKARLMGEFIPSWIEGFRRICPSDWDKETNTETIGKFESLYQLFFYTGMKYWDDYPNDVIKTGLVYESWLDWSLKNYTFYEHLFTELSNAPYNLFRIIDFTELLREFKPSESDKREIFQYTVQYLLVDIYFVSIQEFLSRPYRYFNIRDLDTAFFQVVVIPETVEFTRYLRSKFGIGKLTEVLKTEYSQEAWKRMTDEQINESEDHFTKPIESKEFGGIYTNTQFTDRLTELLKLYNRTTKPTLFEK